MANARQVLDKIARNLEQRDISVSRDGENVIVDGLTISYEAASLQEPIGGVDPANSPYLGIGIGNPGSIKVKGDSGENSLAAIWTSEERMIVLRMCDGHANDVIMEAGDSSAELARTPGHADLIGVGA